MFSPTPVQANPLEVSKPLIKEQENPLMHFFRLALPADLSDHPHEVMDKGEK
jgi:hypothetical protein